MMNAPCLCNTDAALLCPEHEQDSEELRGKAYTTLAMLYWNAAKRVAELEDDKLEHEQSFDIRWKADMRAIEKWHKAGGDPMTWPDHADLCVWLMEQLDAAEKGAPTVP